MAVVFLGVFIGFSSSFSLSFFAAKRIPLEEEKLDRKSIVFLAFTLSVVSSSPRKKKAALFARFIKNGTNGRPPVVPRPRLSSESKEVACIFRSRERRLCVRFFTHENNKKERKKIIRRIRGMETIFITRFEEAPRALLLFLETPFYFLRLYATKRLLSTFYDYTRRLYATKRLYATSTKRNKRSVFFSRSVQPRGTSYRTKRALTGLESGSRERGSNPLLLPGTRVKRRDFRFRSIES